MSRYTTLEWARSALITIDTQRDTLDGQPLGIPGTSAVLPRMRRLVAAYRRAGMPIVHIVRLYQADGANVDLCRREQVEQGAPILLAGSSGSQLAPDLLPQAGIRLDPDLLLAGGIQSVGDREVVIYKPRWGAFHNTPLEAHLRRNRITTVVFCGCNFPNCPRTSIYQASERDFRIAVVEDAVSGIYDRGRRELTGIGVAVMPADDVIRALENMVAAF